MVVGLIRLVTSRLQYCEKKILYRVTGNLVKKISGLFMYLGTWFGVVWSMGVFRCCREFPFFSWLTGF